MTIKLSNLSIMFFAVLTLCCCNPNKTSTKGTESISNQNSTRTINDLHENTKTREIRSTKNKKAPKNVDEFETKLITNLDKIVSLKPYQIDSIKSIFSKYSNINISNREEVHLIKEKIRQKIANTILDEEQLLKFKNRQRNDQRR